MSSSDIFHTELHHCRRNVSGCYYGLECRMLARVIDHNYNSGPAPEMTPDEIKRTHSKRYHPSLETMTGSNINIRGCPSGPTCVLYLNEDMDYEYRR
jgi:hypothetical protein